MIKEELKIREQIIINPLDKNNEIVSQDIREEGFSNPAIWDYIIKLFKKK